MVINAEILRFFGMYAPSVSLRIAMYRKAGIHIGNVSVFGSRIWLDINFKNLITIGDNVILAGDTQILSHSSMYRKPEEGETGFHPVTIKNGARIGMGVIILPGVTIGENSVIGAGAVVTNNIPPNCVAVGIPAKPFKYFK